MNRGAWPKKRKSLARTRTYARWTEEEDRTIATLRLDGESNGAIAERIDRSRDSVLKRLRVLMLTEGDWRERARRLLEGA